ncbi:MAG: hypothetical protein JWQ34_2876 [Mucilaginibacter sp.]|uniref:head GIN domain-containing protein n=1 Tax=Mucilaginibacter sp. TaxID=1882438 RepID=UPI00260762B6|nr:head GIN domain-containing protein [Mucilaginibacter sp.]MDB5004651.1 hypothetical protein [Mucilaginibacter sp.]
MKKSYLTILTVIAGISLLALSSCRMRCERGSGHWITENRKVTDFKKLDISGAFDVVLKQDSSLTVSVAADDNLLKIIKTEIDGDKLRISTDGKNICSSSGDLTVTIGVHNLNDIKALGAINITSTGKIVAKDIHLDLAGATKVNIDLDAANVNTEANGATEIALKGQATSHTIDLNGGGKVHAFDFVVGNYSITTQGASECEINVLHDLTVNSSGASVIKYKGNPTSIKNEKSGASSITKVN